MAAAKDTLAKIYTLSRVLTDYPTQAEQLDIYRKNLHDIKYGPRDAPDAQFLGHVKHCYREQSKLCQASNADLHTLDTLVRKHLPNVAERLSPLPLGPWHDLPKSKRRGLLHRLRIIEVAAAASSGPQQSPKSAKKKKVRKSTTTIDRDMQWWDEFKRDKWDSKTAFAQFKKIERSTMSHILNRGRKGRESSKS